VRPAARAETEIERRSSTGTAARAVPPGARQGHRYGEPVPDQSPPPTADALRAALAPGDHGGDGPRLAAALGVTPEAVLDLSQSLNPQAPDVRGIVARHLDELGRYPDPTRARDALAEAIGTDRRRLMLTNGGAEAIALVAGHLGCGWVEEPEFSLYRRHLSRLDPGAPRLRSNPHSPSGRLAPAGDRAGVWDEAFYQLATGTWTRGDAERGAYVVGSLTKLWAAPGLRLGYVLAPDDDAAAAVARRQPAWATNGLACAAMPDLLEATDLPAWSAAVARLRAGLVDLLAAHGLRAKSSDANWVLVAAPGLRDALLPHAVAVRDCASFGLPGTVRIAVPDEDGLRRLDQALSEMENR
jgi:histidinol-phosphate/aromatic aminotransferase/cobyric acid decarboxylase-like protein